MHGDEIVGRELMVRLAADLLRNDGNDPWITKLLDDVQIYIMPSMNPDGAGFARRSNANFYDLNRDFPDFTTDDNQNTIDGRQPETQAMMRWQAQRRFKLSANFHGGAEVVNYPWDTTPNAHPRIALVKDLSLDYANRAPYLFQSTVFENGIVNGYTWYEVNGGMQDWSSYWHNDLQVTIELSEEKWPAYFKVEEYYSKNREALINFIGRVREL
jgi:predicted deacylase